MSQTQALSEWISQVDQYQQFNSDGKKIGADLCRINELLPINSSARKKLNTGTHDGNTQARINFLEFLHKNIFTNSEIKAYNAEPIEIKSLLSEQGMKLYEAAIAEERNSKNFREAVFVNSCNHYDGLKWKKKMVLWVGGPSASGKSFGAEAIINQVEYQMEKETAGARPKKDTSGKIIVDKRGNTDYEFEEPGNDVISIDGGIEREISQMRQMLLQVALSKGYIGVENLDKTTLDTKKYVQKAAEDTDNLSMVIPNTFANPLKKIKNKLRMEVYEEDKNIEQFFSIVDGEMGQGSQFKDTVFHSGTTRAWYDHNSQGNFTATQVRMNNTNIGCESKVYDPKPFSRGKNESKRMMQYFRTLSNNPGSHTVTFITDLVHIYKNPNNSNKWEICPTSEKPTHKMSKRDFTNFKIFLHDPELWASQSDIQKKIWDHLQHQNPDQINPNDWLKACRQNGIASQPIIQTDSELKVSNKDGFTLSSPKLTVSRRHSISIPQQHIAKKRPRTTSEASLNISSQWHKASSKNTTGKRLFDITARNHNKLKIQTSPNQKKTFIKQHEQHKVSSQESSQIKLSSITHAARSDWQNNNHTKIQDIKMNKEETGDINQATISFIGSTNNSVETYIQKTNADNLQFSIQKDTNQNDQGIIIGELCSLAVKTANKNTIFNIPDSLDDEKITLISTAFENAIAQAIHDGLFTKENCPTVGHPEAQESKASQTLRK